MLRKRFLDPRVHEVLSVLLLDFPVLCRKIPARGLSILDNNGVWDVQGDRIAPNLTHFANRNVFAGAALKNNPENLTKWLANPAEIKPGTFMPNLELTESEINALIAYLETLK